MAEVSMRVPYGTWIIVAFTSLLVVIGVVTFKVAARPRQRSAAIKHARPVAGEASPSSRHVRGSLAPTDDEAASPEERVSPEQRLAEVKTIIDEGADPARLADAVAGWSSDAETLPARRAALTALQKAQPPSLRLSSLVSAASTMALAKDPLRAEMVRATTETLASDTLQRARDMMISASDPGSRELLASSLAAYAGSDRGLAEMTPAQKDGVRSDFIDLYRNVPEEQQREMAAAVERMAGPAAADLLRGIARR